LDRTHTGTRSTFAEHQGYGLLAGELRTPLLEANRDSFRDAPVSCLPVLQNVVYALRPAVGALDPPRAWCAFWGNLVAHTGTWAMCLMCFTRSSWLLSLASGTSPGRTLVLKMGRPHILRLVTPPPARPQVDGASGASACQTSAHRECWGCDVCGPTGGSP